MVQLAIEVPDTLEVEQIAIEDLPPGWRNYPAPAALQQRGDDWLDAGTTPLLRVPSAVIPEEFNLIINPAHPEARTITVVSTREFRFDERLEAP
jgi:RES domain-containing protein